MEIGYSQSYIYEHFGIDEGLPSSEVYDIYQDKEGYIWFATDKGLSRFNGYEFENFTTQDGLPDNTILDFFPQENGEIWCFGYHSQNFFYFNEVFDGFKSYRHNNLLKGKIDVNTIVKSIVFDDNETMYAGGYGICGLLEITRDGELRKHFDQDARFNKSIEHKYVNLGIHSLTNSFFSICNSYESERDVIVIRSKDIPASRLDVISLNDDQAIFIDRKLGILSKKGGITYYDTEHNPIGIKRINDHTFFVGFYNNGAEIRDIDGEIIDAFLPKKSVTGFLMDREGGYWFSTLDDGIYYIKNPGIKVFSKEHISSLVKDNGNILYAGYNNGNIARILKMKTDIIYRGLNYQPAYVEIDKENNDLYAYSDTHFINYNNKKKPVIPASNKSPEHIGNPILNSGTYYFNILKKDSIIKYSVVQNVQDVCTYKNDILIGTSSGLYLLKDEVIREYHPKEMLKSRIYDLDINKNTNTVFMATQGQGVVVYGDSIYNINQDNGLTNNIVSEVHIENDSIVWACTSTGLNKININSDKTFDVTTITKEDGLLSNDIEDIEIINDTVWVATKKGLCFFKKDFFVEKKASNILSLKLKAAKANNTSFSKENINLQYDQNTIDFKVLAISHRNTNRINYLYRLKEVDTLWKSTTNRNIHFPSLSPGDYTFEAKANVLDYPNHQLISYRFTILPPFWKSWWFYGCCFLLFSGLVYLFFKIRVLTYNQDVFRELIRLAIKRLRRNELFYNFRSNGEDFKIPTQDIQYINSQGNYLDIITKKKTYTFRCKIGDFIHSTPDPLEYLRLHRSYIVRIDQVTSKGKNWVVINGQRIPVGETYLNELDKIHF